MKSIAILSTLLLLQFSLVAKEGIAKVKHLKIWYETFGRSSDPALLLIMGGAGQGIIWPTELCKRLASKGFFVIRYDQRDSGLSTCVEFDKNPYTLFDLACDGIGVMDALALKKAHLFGLSMGGPIAEIMSVHFPDRVSSIAIMASHYDFRPYSLAVMGLPKEPGLLSAPRDEYMQKIKEILNTPATNEEEQVEQRYQTWQVLNGNVFPLDELETKEMLRQFIKRSIHPENLKNYQAAIHASEEMVRAIHRQVKVATVIFYGSEDPIIGPDHPEAMAKAISHSKYYFLEGLGHLPNPHFYDFQIAELTKNAGKL